MSACGRIFANPARERPWTTSRCRPSSSPPHCRNYPPPVWSHINRKSPVMFDPFAYLWLIPVLPLAASVLTGFLGPRLLLRQSHWPCIVAAICSCVLSIIVLVAVGQRGSEIREYYTWFKAGDVDVGFVLRADALTAV